MEKKTISVHAFTVHLYTIAVIVLFLLLIVIGLKYVHLKLAMYGFTESTIWMNMQNRPTGQISDYGLSVAAAYQFVPTADLQDYVSAASKSWNRDVAILDTDRKVLADTVESNIGSTYNFDINGEVEMTLGDGTTRYFEETSGDYPDGITEVVVPIKNASGVIVGAVLVSNSQLPK